MYGRSSSKITAMSYLVLGIESSCDETAAAIIQDGNKALSSIVASQIDVHSQYGGVVPEIASRKHVESIVPVIQAALSEAGVDAKEIDAVAVTKGPGLIGCLMVGLSTGKSIAYGLDVPVIGVNHLEAHLSAVHLEHEVEFPFVGIVDECRLEYPEFVELVDLFLLFFHGTSNLPDNHICCIIFFNTSQL